MHGRNAVVTGGAQGIGRAIVERFLDSGAAVAIWDRDRALAEKTAAELGNRGRLAPVGVDVTELAQVERARDATLARFGRIDILVNNAGIAGPNAHDLGLSGARPGRRCSRSTSPARSTAAARWRRR